MSGLIGIFRETQWWGIENFEIQLMTEKQTSFGAEFKLFVHQKRKKKKRKKKKSMPAIHINNEISGSLQTFNEWDYIVSPIVKVTGNH